MLQINKLSDYATIILSYLAADSTRLISAAQIAQETKLKPPTVSKLLKILLDYKLVKSTRGTTGGYQLARSAKEINLADVLAAIEGKLSMTECCSTTLCAIDAMCTVKENWRKINKVMVSILANVSLHDMIRPLADQTMALRGIPIWVE